MKQGYKFMSREHIFKNVDVHHVGFVFKIGARPRREAQFGSLALSLGGSRVPLGGFRGPEGSLVEYRLCFAVWPKMMKHNFFENVHAA